MPSREPMKTRMSNAPALWALPPLSARWLPVLLDVLPAARRPRSLPDWPDWFSVMVGSSPEDDVQDDHHDGRDGSQLVRLLPPGQLALVGVVEVLPRSQGVDQPAQLGLRLRPGHLGDDDRDDEVDDER